jgi:hypothetical protein
MRIVLRLIAGVPLLPVIATLVFVLQFWRRGGMLPLVSTGPFGLLTALGWLITLVVGPPAVVLLWRKNDAGRRASIMFWGSICLYYLLGLAFFRTPATRYGSTFLCIIVSMVPLALLVSPQAKIACRSRTMPLDIPRQKWPSMADGVLLIHFGRMPRVRARCLIWRFAIKIFGDNRQFQIPSIVGSQYRAHVQLRSNSFADLLWMGLEGDPFAVNEAKLIHQCQPALPNGTSTIQPDTAQGEL